MARATLGWGVSSSAKSLASSVALPEGDCGASRRSSRLPERGHDPIRSVPTGLTAAGRDATFGHPYGEDSESPPKEASPAVAEELEEEAKADVDVDEEEGLDDEGLDDDEADLDDGDDVGDEAPGADDLDDGDDV